MNRLNPSLGIALYRHFLMEAHENDPKYITTTQEDFLAGSGHGYITLGFAQEIYMSDEERDSLSQAFGQNITRLFCIIKAQISAGNDFVCAELFKTQRDVAHRLADEKNLRNFEQNSGQQYPNIDAARGQVDSQGVAFQDSWQSNGMEPLDNGLTRIADENGGSQNAITVASPFTENTPAYPKSWYAVLYTNQENGGAEEAVILGEEFRTTCSRLTQNSGGQVQGAVEHSLSTFNFTVEELLRFDELARQAASASSNVNGVPTAVAQQQSQYRDSVIRRFNDKVDNPRVKNIHKRTNGRNTVNLDRQRGADHAPGEFLVKDEELVERLNQMHTFLLKNIAFMTYGETENQAAEAGRGADEVYRNVFFGQESADLPQQIINVATQHLDNKLGALLHGNEGETRDEVVAAHTNRVGVNNPVAVTAQNSSRTPVRVMREAYRRRMYRR